MKADNSGGIRMG